MASKLNAGTVLALKPKTSRYERPDGGCSGLYLVIHPSGAKTWAVRFRSPLERSALDGQRKNKKLTLGPLATVETDAEPEIGKPLSLAQARVLATRALNRVQSKVDPTHERREQVLKEKVEALKAADGTVDAAMVEFLNKYNGRRNRGIRELTRLLTAAWFGLKRGPVKGEWIKTGGGVLAEWSGLALNSITNFQVLHLVEKIKADGQGIRANRTLINLKSFFQWALKRGLMAINPAALVDPPHAEESRERKLSDAELVALWKVSGEYGAPFGDLVRLLILTGARRDELREAPWSEFQLDKAGYVEEADYTLDAGLWRLPKERAKNRRAHLVPLTPMVVDLFKGLPRIKGKPALLFTVTGTTPFSALSGAKKRLDKALLAELRKADKKAKLERWTLHDLRRTFATGLQRIGVPSDIIEACTNHVSGSLHGVAGTYQRDKLLRQKHEALEAWSRHVDRLVKGKTAGVTELATRRVPA